MNSSEALKPQFDRLQQGALVVGGSLWRSLSRGGWRGQRSSSVLSSGYVFWIGFPLGSMALLMLHTLPEGIGDL